MGKEVTWQDIERLANMMGRVGRDFDEADKAALELIFEAAGDELTGQRQLTALGTIFDSGFDSGQARAAFKVRGLYPGDRDRRP